jgi:hypothetical protein
MTEIEEFKSTIQAKLDPRGFGYVELTIDLLPDTAIKLAPAGVSRLVAGLLTALDHARQLESHDAINRLATGADDDD